MACTISHYQNTRFGEGESKVMFFCPWWLVLRQIVVDVVSASTTGEATSHMRSLLPKCVATERSHFKIE